MVLFIKSTYPLRAGAADVGMFFGIYARAPSAGRPRLARWPRGEQKLDWLPLIGRGPTGL